MLKKCLLILLCVLSSIYITACSASAKCKVDGCDDISTDGDYCSYHAKLKNIDSVAKDLFDTFLG